MLRNDCGCVSCMYACQKGENKQLTQEFGLAWQALVCVCVDLVECVCFLCVSVCSDGKGIWFPALGGRLYVNEQRASDWGAVGGGGRGGGFHTHSNMHRE